jgi:hypothetical protein
MACRRQCASVGLLLIPCLLIIMASRFRAPDLQNLLLHAPLNITVPFFGGPALRVFLISSDRRRVLRLVRALDSAVYPVGLVAHLTIVNATPMHIAWRRGNSAFESQLRVTNSSELAVILSDTMEVSPFYALWFLRQVGDRVSVGGGDLDHPAGIGFRGALPHAAGSLAFILRGLLAIRNCTAAVFPATDRVFVREGWQNPLLPERSPKLERAWAV